LKQALKDCDESLRFKPDDADTLDSRGFANLKSGNFDKAAADFDAALKLNPKLASSLYGRGIAKNKKQSGSGEADLAAAKAIDAKIAETFAGYGVK
jgi:tetratricopeptide (TPR) repeat protein